MEREEWEGETRDGKRNEDKGERGSARGREDRESGGS